MNLKVPVVLALLLLSTLGLSGGPATGGLDERTAYDRSSFTETGPDLFLKGDLLFLGFNRSTGGLSSVYDPSRGEELRSGTSVPPVLFELVLENTAGDVTVLSSSSPCTFSYQGGTQGSRSNVTFTYLNLSGLGIDVMASVEVRDGEPRSSWGLSFINSNTSIMIVEARYPIVQGLSSDLGSNGVEDRLAMPRYDGIIYTDPFGLAQPPTSAKLQGAYPRELSMQFMALYDPAAVGLYLEAQDSEGTPKSFFLEATAPIGNARTGIAHKFPEAPASNGSVPYNVSLALFHGDWSQAAELYKGWALSQPWTAKGPLSERSDVPEWWLAPTAMISLEQRDVAGADKATLEQWSEVVASYKVLTKRNVTLQVKGWEKEGQYASPFYLPPKDGPDPIKTEVKEVLVSGGHVMFSTSEGLWRLQVPQSGYDSTVLFNTYGDPWAVMNASGGFARDARAEQLGMPAIIMDPTTAYWQSSQATISGGVADLLVDVQELQDLPDGSWQPCYNSSHGHPAGYSVEMTEGHQALVAGAYAAGRAENQDFMMTTEGPSELLLSLTQAHGSDLAAPWYGRYLDEINAYGPSISPAPMFSYVYHPYITAYGTPVPVGGAEVLRYFNSSAYAIASAYTLGQMPSVQSPASGTGNTRLTTLLTRVMDALSEDAREFVLLGEMQQAPDVQAPDTEIEYRIDPRPGGEAAGWGVARLPQVLSSAWTTTDGSRLAFALVNWGNTTADVSIDMQRYDLPDQNYSLVMTRNGVRSTLAASTRLPTATMLSLAARDVVLIEAVHATDLAIEGITAEPTMLSVGGTVNVTVDVANRGSAMAMNVHVFLYENGTYANDTVVPEVGPDSNTTVMFEWPTAGRRTGTYDLSAQAWPFFGEISEENNVLSTTVTVLPPPSGDIRCTVIDNSTLDPLPGATVVLFHPSNGSFIDQAVTIQGKDVMFIGIPPGVYGLNISKNGYQPAERRDINVTADKTTLLTIALDPIEVPATKGTLYGVVRDSITSAPVPGATVKLVQPNITYVTGTDGLYSFVDVDAGLYDMTVSATDHLVTNLKVTVVAGNLVWANVTLTYSPPPPTTGDIVGTVVQSGTGTPISGAMVNLTGSDIQPMETISDPVGGFLFPDVPFGSYVLNVTAAGHYSAEESVEVEQEGENPVTVVLKAMPAPPPEKVTLKGFVKDKHGKALNAVEVRIMGLTPEPYTYTDASGNYQLSDVRPGTIIVKASLKGYLDHLETVNVTGSGAMWLNVTLERRSTGTTGLSTTATYVLVALDVLMLVGIVLMVVTGRRTGAHPVRHARRPLKRTAVTARPEKKATVRKGRKIPEEE